MVRASLYFSAPRLRASPVPKAATLIFKRSLVLFAIGVAISHFPFTAPLDQ